MSRWQPSSLHIFISERIAKEASLPDSIRKFLHPTSLDDTVSLDKLARTPAVLAYASEIIHGLSNQDEFLNRLITQQTRYLLLKDEMPVSGLMWLPSLLRLRRPEQRLHLTSDITAVRRLLVAQLRNNPLEGVVDAYVLDEMMNLILGDLRLESVPLRKIPRLKDLKSDQLFDFEIDEDGSYISFSSKDLHFGPLQLLQIIHPEWRAEAEINRISKDWSGEALARWRTELEIRQSDIGRLSERQVRRIEQRIARLTLQSAKEYAKAFGLELPDFLDELARRASNVREEREGELREPEGISGPVFETFELRTAA
jgi:hypothetical protein